MSDCEVKGKAENVGDAWEPPGVYTDADLDFNPSELEKPTPAAANDKPAEPMKEYRTAAFSFARECKFSADEDAQPEDFRDKFAAWHKAYTGEKPEWVDEAFETYFHRPWHKIKHAPAEKTTLAKPEFSKADFTYTDIGNGNWFVVRNWKDVRYAAEWKRWLTWDSTRWKPDDDSCNAEHLAKQTIRWMYERAAKMEDDAARAKTVAHAMATEKRDRLRAMIAMARSVPSIRVEIDDLNKKPWLLNCPNGTLDLQTGTLRPHERGDFLTSLCPTEYHADAECPIWERFLDKIFKLNIELIGYVQRFLGYCLTGNVMEQILPIFWGTGSNGKSVLLETMLAVLGQDFSMKAPADFLTVTKSEQHPTRLAQLFGKRLVSAIETEDGKRLAESLTKELTGGDRLRARGMRENFWEFSPTHKIILATNHKPQMRGTDHGIWRRLRLIPFTVTIPDNEQDKQLPDKLKLEAQGILSWCVRGCMDWQQNGLGLPDEVKAATAEYKTEQDVLSLFIEECCFTGHNDYQCRASALYERYTKWCESNGEYCANQRRFGSGITEKGFERKKNNGIWYLGIALTE